MSIIFVLMSATASASMIVYGAWIWMGLPIPKYRHKKCHKCGSLGWVMIREDYCAVHKKCVRCEWVSHFAKKDTLWRT